MDGAHGWLHVFPHIAQIAGGLAFIYAIGTRVDVRLRTKKDAALEAEAERLREQLERSQRSESIGQLAGGVAHDFSNLLAVILNYSSFVHDDLPTGDPRREDVAEIKQAAERARDLTHQLLVFSRRERARAEVVPVASALDSANNLLRRTLGEQIELRMSSDLDLWSVALGRVSSSRSS